jgi:hypothetical protein
MSQSGITLDTLDNLFFGAFSAGGSIVKRALENPDYRAVTTAVHLADATYTGAWLDERNRIAPPIEGFVQYGVDVAQGSGDKLFVATASPVPNKNWPSGVENLQALRREIEKRTGRQFVERSDFFGVDPGPEHAYQLGNVILAEYPLSPLGHNHTKIAGQVWQNIIQPWLAKGKGALDEPGGLPGPVPPVPLPTEPGDGVGIGGVLLALGAAAGGYLLVRQLMRRS